MTESDKSFEQPSLAEVREHDLVERHLRAREQVAHPPPSTELAQSRTIGLQVSLVPVEQSPANGHFRGVVILDVRMPPGIDGVEAGSQIRKLDPDVKIVFVTGFSDMTFEELQRRVPPPMHLHYFNKPLSFTQLAEDVVSMVCTH